MKSYNEWYSDFFASVRAKGYNGPIDRDSFVTDFEEGKSPDEAATEFVEEMLS